MENAYTIEFTELSIFSFILVKL